MPPNSSPQDADEREFLHSVMNPLAIARGMIELVMMAAEDSAESGSVMSSQVKERLTKARTALDRSVDLIRERQIQLRGRDKSRNSP